MKKKLLVSMISMLFVTWITSAQSPVIGTWTGTIGNGTSQTGNFFSLQFNANGTMNVLNPDGSVLAPGNCTLGTNSVNGTYYQGAGRSPYSITGTYNPQTNTITGTWGAGTTPKGGGGWIMTAKKGSTTSAAVPFGNKGSFTKVGTTGSAQPATSQPVMKSVPATSGMVISGVANIFSNPSITRSVGGINVTTTMRSNPGSINSNFGGVVNENVINRSNETAQDGTTCVVETKSVTANSDNFLSMDYSNQAATIYPGAIYTFNDFMTGNRKDFVQGRNPIRIGTSKTSGVSGATYRDVQNPNRDVVNTAISSIRNTFSEAGSNISYRIYTSSSEAELGVKAAAAGGFAGFSASGGYSNQSRESYYVMTIEAFKTFFSMSTDLPANGYFADKSIEQNNRNLIVIKNVVYGCRVLANVIIKTSSKREDLDFQASYKGVSANANAAFNYFRTSNSVESNVNAYIVGGPQDATVLSASNLQQGIAELISRVNQQNAEPISYTFTDINGNVLGIESATDVFTTRSCLPKSSAYKLVNVSVDVTTGTNDPKNSGSVVNFRLFNSNNILTAASSGTNNVEFPAGSFKNFSLQPTAMDVSKFVVVPVNREEALDLKKFTTGYLEITFTPVQIALGWDEWQITGVTLNMVFQDQNMANVPFMLKYDNQNIYLKKDRPSLRLPFTSNGVSFVAGGAYQPQ